MLFCDSIPNFYLDFQKDPDLYALYIFPPFNNFHFISKFGTKVSKSLIDKRRVGATKMGG